MYATAIGLSTIASAQRALDIIGQNIANAATPGYHRQSPALVDRVYDGINGVGVEVKRVIRYEDELLRRGILNSTTDVAHAQTRLDIESQIETQFSVSGIDGQIGTLFDRINQLAARPDDLTLRRSTIASAVELSDTLNDLAGSLTTLRAGVGRNITAAVEDINRMTADIAALNQQIARVEMTGKDANDLMNQRDLIIQNLSELIDVRVIPQEFGQVNVIGAGTALVLNNTSLTLNAAIDGSDNYIVYTNNPAQPLAISAGKLGGLLHEYNQAIPGYTAQLDELALGIMQYLDELQATGLDLNGPLSFANGQRSVTSDTVPLDSAGLAIPPTAGDLYISVTSLATGQRTLVSVAIDPSTQSLQDVAAAITAATGGQVQAAVDVPTGVLQLQAAAGFAFDFAGRLPTSPDAVVMNGTSVPVVAGTYMGAANDVYSFQVVGSGTVGVTAGLSLEVRDGGGTLLATLNIGAGYTPDSPLNAGNGITVSLSAGTTNNGSFSARMIAQPDTAGLLPALGLNSFFTGVSAATIAVRPELVADPSLLSASRSGQIGDARNLERFAALRDQAVLAGNTLSFEEFSQSVSGAIGDEVRSLDLRRLSSETLLQGLIQQEQRIIGVDVNEEMVRLLEFERMVEAGAKYLSVVNSAMDELLNIIK